MDRSVIYSIFLVFFSRPELPWSEVGFTYHFRSVFLWTEVHTGQKCYLLNFHEFFQRARTTLVRSRIYRLFHKFFSMDRSTCRSEVLFSHIILEIFFQGQKYLQVRSVIYKYFQVFSPGQNYSILPNNHEYTIITFGTFHIQNEHYIS